MFLPHAIMVPTDEQEERICAMPMITFTCAKDDNVHRVCVPKDMIDPGRVRASIEEYLETVGYDRPCVEVDATCSEALRTRKQSKRQIEEKRALARLLETGEVTEKEDGYYVGDFRIKLVKPR